MPVIKSTEGQCEPTNPGMQGAVLINEFRITYDGWRGSVYFTPFSWSGKRSIQITVLPLTSTQLEIVVVIQNITGKYKTQVLSVKCSSAFT